MPHITPRALRSLGALVCCAALAFPAIYAAESLAQGAKPADALAGKLSRRELQRAASSIPNREIVQVVTEIPAGVESGWHVHPGEEVGYIAAGQVEMRVQGRATVVLRAGQGFIIPPGTPHNARDLGPETGRMLSTYIVETGRPLSTFVEPPPDKR